LGIAEEIRRAQEKAKKRKVEKKKLAENTIKDSTGIRWQKTVEAPTQLQSVQPVKEQERQQDQGWMHGWEISNDK
jgi:hypothetical protein